MHRGQIAVTAVVVSVLLVGSAVALGPAPSQVDAPLDTSSRPDAAGAGADVTRIDSCTVIEEPGRYVLTADIEDNQETRLSETCIRIAADDVVLEGDGHLVDGRGISDTRGVTATGANVTVRNVTVSDWDRGLYYGDVSGGSISGVNATANGFGIDLDRSADVTLEDNDVSGNMIGVDLGGSNSGVELVGNRVDGNYLADVKGNGTA